MSLSWGDAARDDPGWPPVAGVARRPFDRPVCSYLSPSTELTAASGKAIFVRVGAVIRRRQDLERLAKSKPPSVRLPRCIPVLPLDRAELVAGATAKPSRYVEQLGKTSSPLNQGLGGATMAVSRTTRVQWKIGR